MIDKVAGSFRREGLATGANSTDILAGAPDESVYSHVAVTCRVAARAVSPATSTWSLGLGLQPTSHATPVHCLLAHLTSLATSTYALIMIRSSHQGVAKLLVRSRSRNHPLVTSVILAEVRHAHAGPSRLPYLAYHRAYPSRKGKEKEIINDSHSTPYTLYASHSSLPIRGRLGELGLAHQRRSFHATARRQAIPLIPATIGILKVGEGYTAVNRN